MSDNFLSNSENKTKFRIAEESKLHTGVQKKKNNDLVI